MKVITDPEHRVATRYLAYWGAPDFATPGFEIKINLQPKSISTTCNHIVRNHANAIFRKLAACPAWPNEVIRSRQTCFIAARAGFK